jgi:amphi-Trp domain-containing protein
MAEHQVSEKVADPDASEKLEVRTSMETFVQALKNMIEGIENGHEFEIELKDQHIYLPPDGEMEIDIDKTERELHIKYIWRY